MENDKSGVNFKFKDNSGIIIEELLKTQAYIRSLATILLKEDQYDEFTELFLKEVGKLQDAFFENNPDIQRG